MPTYNNVNYLSLPQQVEKNREDIELLKNENFNTWMTSETINGVMILQISDIDLGDNVIKVGDTVLGSDSYIAGVVFVGDTAIELSPTKTYIKGPAGADGTNGTNGLGYVIGSAIDLDPAQSTTQNGLAVQITYNLDFNTQTFYDSDVVTYSFGGTTFTITVTKTSTGFQVDFARDNSGQTDTIICKFASISFA